MKKKVKKGETLSKVEAPVDIVALLRKVSKESKLVLSTDDLLSDSKFKIPTGCFVLDVAIGGGFPTGRMVEVFGHESSGKSTLVTQSAIECQRMGGMVYLIDHETGFDKDRAAAMGLDLSRFLMMETPTCEETFVAIKDILDKQSALSGGDPNFPTLIIWDTIAASQTLKEKAMVKWGEGKEVGGKSRIIHEGFRQLPTILAANNACMIFVNQVRTVIGAYIPSTESPGGWAMKHFPSLRIRLSASHMLYEGLDADEDGDEDDDKGKASRGKKKDKGIPIGIITRIKVIKSKVRRPGSELEVPLYFDRGLDDTDTLLSVLRRAGVVSQSSAWFRLVVPLTEDQARAVAGPGVTSGKEDGKTFIRFQGEARWSEMCKRSPDLIPAFQQLVLDNERYV